MVTASAIFSAGLLVGFGLLHLAVIVGCSFYEARSVGGVGMVSLAFVLGRPFGSDWERSCSQLRMAPHGCGMPREKVAR